MKYLIFTLLFSTGVCNLFSQEDKKYEFTGALRTSNGDIISYKVNFKLLADGIIEGESITDFYGKEYTVSKITGTLNTKKNRLSFTESENISSKSSENENIFCYIKVVNLNIRKADSKRIINGQFEGVYNDNKSCASGSIYLVGKNFLKKYNINNDSLKRLDSMMHVVRMKKEVTKLKKGDTLTVNWEEPNILLEVWDGSKEDDDVIDIYFNNKLIEKNLIIKNKPITVKIPFDGLKGFLKVVAISEGTSKTNTVSFLLRTKTSQKPFVSKLYKGEYIIVDFNQQ